MSRKLKITRINSLTDPTKKILFLGYKRNQTRLIDELISRNCEVHHTEAPINETDAYDLIISFGYRYIIRKEIIDSVGCPIFNLHISYLPYNKGAHPNFWSFFDNTPSGVTIHLIDEGVDTGPIVYQEYVNFHQNEFTFSQTYARLKEEVESLFLNYVDEILSGRWVATPQTSVGTTHAIKDLPNEFAGWDSNIDAEVKRLKNLLGNRNE